LTIVLPSLRLQPDADAAARHQTGQNLVRAPAPGQSAVLYDGERALGGGFIADSK